MMELMVMGCRHKKRGIFGDGGDDCDDPQVGWQGGTNHHQHHHPQGGWQGGRQSSSS